eukprot:232740-Chlamydomonas_euryale.AAC.1
MHCSDGSPLPEKRVSAFCRRASGPDARSSPPPRAAFDASVDRPSLRRYSSRRLIACGVGIPLCLQGGRREGTKKRKRDSGLSPPTPTAAHMLAGLGGGGGAARGGTRGAPALQHSGAVGARRAALCLARCAHATPPRTPALRHANSSSSSSAGGGAAHGNGGGASSNIVPLPQGGAQDAAPGGPRPHPTAAHAAACCPSTATAPGQSGPGSVGHAEGQPDSSSMADIDPESTRPPPDQASSNGSGGSKAGRQHPRPWLDEPPLEAVEAVGAEESAMLPDIPTGLAEHFMLEYELGTGEYGIVYVGRSLRTGQRHAVKVVPKARQGRSLAENLERIALEIQIWRACQRSAYVISCDGVFQDADNVYLVQELCPGGDISVAMHGGGLSEHQAAEIMLAVLDVIAICHANDYVFGDIK